MVKLSGKEFADDPEISDDTVLLRRIIGSRVKAGEIDQKPSSDNFKDDPVDDTGTSVDVWEPPRQPDDLLKEFPDDGVVSLPVSEIRKLGLGVIRDALDGNPHHALIQGNKSKSIRRKLSHISNWEIRPKALT